MELDPGERRDTRRPGRPGDRRQRSPAPGLDHRAAFRPATFADALRSEADQLRSPWSTFWALTAATVVLGVGLGAAIEARAAADGYASSSAPGKLSWDPTALSLDGQVIATLAIAVLAGVLCISSEHFVRDDPHQPDQARPQARLPTGYAKLAALRRGDLRRK